MNTLLLRPGNMKSIAYLICSVVGILSLQAAAPKATPVPAYFINGSPVGPGDAIPQVDASIFINSSTFVISNNNYLFTPFYSPPWSAQSVQLWTNSGTMVGLPGFRLDYTPNPAHMTSKQRRKRGALSPQAAFAFDNSGEISVSDTLTINAKTIVNSGVLSGDLAARLRLIGGAGFINLSRGAINVGALPVADCVSGSNLFFGFFGFNADPAVSYRYTSTGTSGFVNTNRTQLDLPSLTNSLFSVTGPYFVPPSPLIPPSQYVLRQSLFPGAPATNVVTNILTTLANCGLYGTFVHVQTNFSGATPSGRNITVVFVPTNGFSENVSVGVAFPTNNQFATLPDDPIVEFRVASSDVITQQPRTSFITFRNAGQTIFRGHDCEFDLADQPNALYAPDIFYNTNFVTNAVNYTYTVVQAHVGDTNSFYYTNGATAGFLFPELGQSPAASDPTNFPGRLEISAKDLDLTQARLRAENGIFIRATNLIGNQDASLDAPFVSFDVGTTNRSMVISNLLVPNVSRVQADFNSWSGSWSVTATNGLTTETLNYRVLILGACVNGSVPTIVHRFHVQATNVVIEDKLAVNASLLFNGQSLTVGSNGGVSLPRASNLAYSNLVGIVNLTNSGVLSAPNGAFFGIFEDGYVQAPLIRKQSKKFKGPRLLVYTNVINHGDIRSSTVKVRAKNVESIGESVLPASIVSSNGVLSLDGGHLTLSNTLLQARSDVRLTAGQLLATRTLILAGATNTGAFGTQLPGKLIIDATNSLADGGLLSSNVWRANGGVQLLRRPTTPGDLLGTHIAARAGSFAQSFFVWAAENRGTNLSGYNNNLALGRLTLDGANANFFRFKGTAANNAVYIDYLELLNDATNYNFAIGVDPGFTIYFADSNVEPWKLDSLGGGRIRWVSSYVGAQSGTNLVYPNGLTYRFNAGVVRNPELDDDGDLIGNAFDCTPLPVPGFDTTGAQCPPVPTPLNVAGKAAATSAAVSLHVDLSTDGREVTLNWNAPANSTTSLEYSGSLSGGEWQSLTNFINGPVDARVTVKDATKAPFRVYRVRVDAGKP